TNCRWPRPVFLSARRLVEPRLPVDGTETAWVPSAACAPKDAFGTRLRGPCAPLPPHSLCLPCAPLRWASALAACRPGEGVGASYRQWSWGVCEREHSPS